MKKTITAILLLPLALAGCHKQEPETPADGLTSEVTVEVTDEAATRVTSVSAGDETRIQSLQVAVFGRDGQVEAYARSSGSTLTLNITCGTGKQFRAAVNCAADLSTAGTAAQWDATTVRLQDCAKDRLPMYGYLTRDITADTRVSINVSRLVARVSVSSVKRSFEAPSLAAKTFSIRSVYLINAAGSTTLAGGAPSLWLNRGRLEGGTADALLCDANINTSLTNGSSYDVAHSFYCCPNPTSSDSQGGTWSARRTRLVVEAQLDGVTMYYPVTLPQIQPNRTYTVSSLVITGKGASSPDAVIEKSTVSATVTIKDWASGATYTEKI